MDGLNELTDDEALRRRSRWIAHACGAIAITLPSTVAFAWTMAWPDVPLLHRIGAAASTPPGLAQVVIATMAAVAPVLALSFALLSARRFFCECAQGGWFTERAAGCLRAFGARIALSATLGLLAPTVVGLALTAHLGTGERTLAIAISSGPVLGLLFGAMVWLIADVQRRAAILAADHAQIV